MVGESPTRLGAPGFGSTQPHSPERSTPYTSEPRPAADSTTPNTSNPSGRAAGGASLIRRATARIARTTTTSPANTSRQVAYVVRAPPIRGPTATAIAPADATRPYARGRPAGAKFDATRATIAGMISAAPMPSRNDQPMIRTVRFPARAVVKDPHP